METQEPKKWLKFRLSFSEFSIPPCHTILVVGKRAPIGKNATMRMLDTIAPALFEMFEVDDDIVEAIIIKCSVSRMVGTKELVGLVLEEARTMMTDKDILNVDMDFEIVKDRIVEIKS